jgi:hypothetical protein
VELGRDLASFDHVDAERDSRLSFPGELNAKCGQLSFRGRLANRPDRFVDRPKKSNRTFGDDDMDGWIIDLEPKQPVGGESCHRIDAPAESRSKVIRVQRHRRLDPETRFIVRYDPHAHRPRNRDLFVQEFFRGADSIGGGVVCPERFFLFFHVARSSRNFLR